MVDHERISHLRHKIEEYEGYISELEEACSFVDRTRVEIRNDNEEPLKSFDISSAGAWEGVLEDEAEDRKNKILGGIASSLSQASSFISDAQEIIETLREKISDYENEIESLEAAQDGECL